MDRKAKIFSLVAQIYHEIELLVGFDAGHVVHNSRCFYINRDWI